MYTFFDDFFCHDDNKQPYSIETERHSAIDNLHCAVSKGAFHLKSIGNRQIFKTPCLRHFNFTIHFSFTFMYEFNPSFTVFFHYNKQTRSGSGIRIVYDLAGLVSVSLIKIDKMKTTELSSITFNHVLREGERYVLGLCVEQNQLIGSICDQPFRFLITESNGYLAIERKNFIGELLIYDVTITSNDSVQRETVIEKQTLTIPLLNGGDIPYCLIYEIQKINDVYYLSYELTGGTAIRKVNREDRPGQYVAEMDWLTAPYIFLRRNGEEKKIYIFNDTKVLVDPNVYWDCMKQYFEMPQFPIKGQIAISPLLVGDGFTISFGYEYLMCRGYMMQSGGPSEFIFDTKGQLLYSGAALSGNVCLILSPKDKFVKKLIDSQAYQYEQLMKHLEDNHYFAVNEEIAFTFSVKTKLNPENIKVRAEIRDIYDVETLAEFYPKIKIELWQFGFCELSCEINHEPLEEKLYRMVFYIYYSNSCVDTCQAVFEVYDMATDISPAIASGLPYAFSMPNEQKWLERNGFDLWSPMPSCNVEHYISCVTDTPIEAERRRVWEVIKPFKREWFAWLGDRTCRDWELENHLETVKNSDYLYYPLPVELFPIRNDLYLLQTYTYNPEIRKILHKFLEEHPEIREKMSFSLEDSKNDTEKMYMLVDETGLERQNEVFTYAMLKELLDVCHTEWFDYATTRLLEVFKEQNRKLSALNSHFKRSIYGPYNQYGAGPLSYHTIKSFGMLPDERLSEHVYTGFCVFEDYPYSCGYQTCRGAFGVMTILLHVPHIKIYPEQYKNGAGGCIDGAVKFAHGPMGKYELLPYQNSTHAFEFVFNTPYRLSDGYHYWDTYGFHRPDYPTEWWEQLVRDWKNVIDYRPKKPLRTMGFIADYSDEEDSYNCEIISLANTSSLENRSEQGHAYLYEYSRTCGLNAGFAVKFDTIKALTPEECDVLVLPSLRFAEKSVIDAIRKLFQSGVSLVAVSDVTGLEDVFGVSENKRSVFIDTLEYDDEKEFIYPNGAELFYDPVDAEVMVTANRNTPIILKKKNAVLLNAPILKLGFECFEGSAGKGRRNVSEIIKKTIQKIILDISNPLAVGENVGLTLFETIDGDTMLLAIDYSSFDNRCKKQHQAIIKINAEKFTDAECMRELTKTYNRNGFLSELRFNIMPHESVFIKLISV